MHHFRYHREKPPMFTWEVQNEIMNTNKLIISHWPLAISNFHIKVPS